MRIITDKDFLEESADDLRKVVEPFDEANLTPAGIDLTIGGKARNVTTGELTNISGGEVLTLRHGDFARVWTQEIIHMPKSWFAMIYAKTSLAGKGLTHLGTKIDPGFEGPLLLTFRYLGNEPLNFRAGDQICNVAFFDMEEIPSNPYIPKANKIVEFPLRPSNFSLNLELGVEKENLAELRQFYSKEQVEFYSSFVRWLQEQEERIDDAMDKIYDYNRNLVLGIIVAAIAGIAATCGTVFLGLVQLVLSP
jgi:deoxycytidine triphosphate deaminase